MSLSHVERPREGAIERVIDFSARNPFLVFLVVASLAAWGVWAIFNVPLDAIPDLSDTQVIIFTMWEGQSPNIIEDQVTYPIVARMLAAPKVTVVRGYSMFSMSFVYVLFEDGTDIYWARSRVLEYLSQLAGALPPGVSPQIGPDATGVGWVFEYALVDESGRNDLADLRAFQDWHLRYWLESVEGVAEVASVGGFEKQYQVDIDPNKLLAYNLPLLAVLNAIPRSNLEVGGRVLEISGREHRIRGRGYITSVRELEKVPVGASAGGTPILLRDVATVHLGPQLRLGAADLDGRGETVGGIVVMRHGQNALRVIDRVKKKLKEIEPGLPKGAKIVTVYDRSDLINRAVATLKRALVEECIIVSLVIIVFLLHFGSAMRAIITLPIAVSLAFIPMYYMGLTSNIMSLGGIAIAIGAMVDEAVVMIENVHKRLEDLPPEADRKEAIIAACKQLGRPMFFSLLVITVSFMPVFTLEAQEGRLFKPLAYTKTFSMMFSALLSITLAPGLMILLTRGRIVPESQHPVSITLQRLYHPWMSALMRRRFLSIALAVLVVGSSVPIFFKLGSEFMPPLNEGSILYMPTTMPGISMTEAVRILQVQDKILRGFPEVERVFGKVGRAETSTDPAPLDMVETVVLLKPQDKWRRGMTWEKLKDEMDQAMRFPGWTNAWTMPIKARIDMLTTGIRTPVGIKVFGPDLGEIERIGEHVEFILREVRGTRSVFAERVTGGYYVDIVPRRQELARYGLTVGDLFDIVQTAIGGKPISTTVEGRERFTINVRYARELRDDIERLKRVLVPVAAVRGSAMATPSAGGTEGMSTMGGGGAAMGPAGAGMGNPEPMSVATPPAVGMTGAPRAGEETAGMAGRGAFDTSALNRSGPPIAQVPLIQLADLRLVPGPPMLKDEDGSLTGWVYVDVVGRDIGSYVKAAKEAVQEKLKLPAGYYLTWTGQYEFMLRVRERLKLVVPLTLAIVVVMLYMNFGSAMQTFIVLLSLPFALTGSIWMLHLLKYQLSIAVWVGMIALAGLSAETGVVMIVYLDEAFNRWKAEGRMRTQHDLFEAITYGAVQRVRPKLMTVMCILMGLLPLMWAHGAGADVMKRIAAPMIGGVITSTILTLEIVPAIYSLWRQREITWEREEGK
jgi:Cu(I)/Ag(I) efflux system membrane protein CusA/SilA